MRFITNGITKTVENSRSSAHFTLEDITPWTPETPQLYDLTVQLLDGERVVDERTVKYGIRTVHVDDWGGFPL